MSRKIHHGTNEFRTVIVGNDHVLGSFADITDKRFANTVYDVQGEGFILEYSNNFKFSTNLIGGTDSDKEEDTFSKCEAFIERIKSIEAKLPKLGKTFFRLNSEGKDYGIINKQDYENVVFLLKLLRGRIQTEGVTANEKRLAEKREL